MSLVTAPLAERPKNTSAPFSASASVRALVFDRIAPTSTGSCPRCGPGRSRPWCRRGSGSRAGSRSASSSSRQAMPAAPAPLQTSLVSSMSRPVRSSALIRPAAAMIAVPCWSSWNTGMSSSSRSRCSMMKHSGALMSSRLMPPQLLPSSLTQLMNSSGILGRDFEIDEVDVGEALEQHRLAFHHRLGRERAEVAEAEDGGAVGDDGDEIALGRVVVGLGSRSSAMASTGTATPGE